nr:retrovirus-related Pol polyprotein from transposon TNT 1-94 [Tanacetum cinerariifolium]
MRTLLIQHECEAALEVLPAGMEAEAKAELNKKAHSVVILCLGNKVLREVTGETIVMGVWSKLETLYMRKSLANKLYLKKKLYTFYMPVGRKISKHIDEFNKIILDLANIKNNRKKSTCYVNKDNQPSSSGSIYDGSEVMIVTSVLALLDWIMDSEGSYHMTLMLDLFFDFLKSDGGRVLLGDNREYKIRGIGMVRVQLKDGSSFMLHNVRYIPELKRNLISILTLEKEGYTVKLQSGKIKVINGSRVILSGTRRDNCVYSLDSHATASELNASVKKKDSLALVWHKRLGHISEAGLQVLEKQGLFGKKSLGKLDFCENYVLAKSHRVNFDVGRHTTQGVIDYVYSDLWGPSQVESLGGKRYFLSIVDDYSRRLVENHTRRTVKKLRMDNGLEFCNREFEELCIESGIARHLTVTGTPQ